MTAPVQTNGQSLKIIWFLLSTLALIVVGLVGAWASEKNTVDADLTRRVTALESQYSRLEEQNRAILDKLTYLVEEQKRRR